MRAFLDAIPKDYTNLMERTILFLIILSIAVLLCTIEGFVHYFFNSNGLWITSLRGIFSMPSRESVFPHK